MLFRSHSTEHSPSTNIISSSNYQDPISRQWEMLRANKLFILENGPDLIKSINMNPNLVTLNHQAYSLVVIDTNCVHRGDYALVESVSGEIDASRIFLEMSVRGKRSGLIFDRFKRDIEADRDLMISARHHSLCSTANLVL